ncbi:MAG: PilZ domain-containing protein [Thermoanaerobaculia bacterium]|nr:PilZ domain-containing protein [Thermoanaerobaculia bacterium]
MQEEATSTAPPEVSETRVRPRFNTLVNLEAQFAGQTAIVRNLSANGLGLRHVEQVKVSAPVSVRIYAPENELATQIRCRVVWSRLSSAGGGRGKGLYDTGLFILDGSPVVAGLVARLIHAYGVRDDDSLETKRRMLEARARERAGGMAPSVAPTATMPPITPDQVLLIRAAQDLIASNPEAVTKWHDRARQSLEREGLIAPDAKSSHHRRDVLVVWEFLGRGLGLDVVSTILGPTAEA